MHRGGRGLGNGLGLGLGLGLPREAKTTARSLLRTRLLHQKGGARMNPNRPAEESSAPNPNPGRVGLGLSGNMAVERYFIPMMGFVSMFDRMGRDDMSFLLS